MELKFVNNGHFKQLFENLRPKLLYSKNIIFMTSHFGTLLTFKLAALNFAQILRLNCPTFVLEL